MTNTIKVYDVEQPCSINKVESIEIQHLNGEIEMFLAKDVDLIEDSSYEIRVGDKNGFINVLPKVNILRYRYKLLDMENESDLKDLTDAIKRNKDKKRYSLDDVEKELGINDDVAR